MCQAEPQVTPLTHHAFEPNFRVVAEMPGAWSITDLEREVGMYSATVAFARRHGGPLTHQLLDHVPAAFFEEADRLGLWPNCDIRIHRLYPGDYPAYPGWHCDGELRETFFSQPDLHRTPVSHHLIATLSSHPMGVSCTQFLAEPFACDVGSTDSEHTLWGQVHRALEAEQTKRVFDVRDGQMIAFDSRTLHRAMPTRIRGWRLFFRMAMWHKPNLGAGGMLSKQEHVYQLVEGSGW